MMPEANHTEGRRVYWIGIALVIAGVLSILAPLAAGLAIGISVGAILALFGGLEIYSWYMLEDRKGRLWQLLQGSLLLLIGLTLISNGLFALGILTVALIVFFGVAGVTRIGAALKIRPNRGWGYVMFDGVVSLLLGVLLLANLGLSVQWAVGVFVGIKLIFAGSALVAVGNEMKAALD